MRDEGLGFGVGCLELISPVRATSRFFASDLGFRVNGWGLLSIGRVHVDLGSRVWGCICLAKEDNSNSVDGPHHQASKTTVYLPRRAFALPRTLKALPESGFILRASSASLEGFRV